MINSENLLQLLGNIDNKYIASFFSMLDVEDTRILTAVYTGLQIYAGTPKTEALLNASKYLTSESLLHFKTIWWFENHDDIVDVMDSFCQIVVELIQNSTERV